MGGFDVRGAWPVGSGKYGSAGVYAEGGQPFALGAGAVAGYALRGVAAVLGDGGGIVGGPQTDVEPGLPITRRKTLHHAAGHGDLLRRRPSAC